MRSDCYSCILDRALFEGGLVLPSEETRRAAVEELLEFMASHKGHVPALVGTERELIIKRLSRSPDPYHALKEESNRAALKLLSVAEGFYEEADDRIEALIRIAAAANSMEFGVKGHDFDSRTFHQSFASTLRERLSGDLSEVKGRLSRFCKVFYLTDNAGEVIFDLFVIERLKEMGKEVVIGSKSEPILNDVTAAELSAITDLPVVPTGGVVGTVLEHLSQEASRILFDPGWLVLAKGMGNFETISEYQERLAGRLIYILRAKCSPVAMELGVPRGTLVVRSV
ncbi:MAG: ARMT1-like domain-containing protein [Methanothrix sp.]|nr:ARMT1-like domain-containing protein [Methanothrix sp.]